MMTRVPLSELTDRERRFRERMNSAQPGWCLAAFFSKVNQFYFTGTMQDGVVLIPRDGEASYWVRRSFERACEESLFPRIRSMTSFKDAAQDQPASVARESVHIESEVVPVALLQRFRKHFPCKEVLAVDPHIASVRAVKSAYELEIMRRVGEVHRRILEEDTPALLREGISETEFACDLFSLMVRRGHQGTVRFNMFGVEFAVGQLGFGENSLYPTNFDGPGGCRGMSPGAPVLGSTDRKLRVGDLVFADVGCSMDGYASDKTMNYVFGRPIPDEAVSAHRRCVEIQAQLASMLKPGAVPSQIYASIMESLEPDFLANFMGFGTRKSNFLGHGVGLQIDEAPVLAKGFDEPLREGMVLALEPKKGVPGVGLVGTENTYIVTPGGGESITGSHPGLIFVGKR